MISFYWQRALQTLHLTRPHLRETRERGVSVFSQRTSAAPTNIRGIDQHLWRWLKVQTALEGMTIGQRLNETLACYTRESETS